MFRYLNALCATALAVTALFITSTAEAAPPLSPEVVDQRDEAMLMALFEYQAAVNYKEPPAVHLKLLASQSADILARIRRTCATDTMEIVILGVAADGQKARQQGGSTTPMPDRTTYCLAAVAEAMRRGTLPDLYASLALQEQGQFYDPAHPAAQAAYLQSNEAGRTLAAILQAANAGQDRYTAISGETRDLSCAMALDAGETWANANSNVTVPVELTQAEATAIAQNCYEPTIHQIAFHGTPPQPASKAGLILGAWLARHVG